VDLKEIDAKIAELQGKRLEALAEEERKVQLKNHKEGVEIVGRLLADLKRLDELDYVPPRIREALTDESGTFSPGRFVKRPRSPSAKPHD
jgi:hypothetical protein